MVARWTVLLISLLAPASALALGEEPVFSDPELELTISLAGLEGFEAKPVSSSTSQLRGAWSGSLAGRDIDIQLWVLSRGSMGFEHPRDVVGLIEDNKVRRQTSQAVPFSYQEQVFLPGRFGEIPFAAVGIHTTYEGTKGVSNNILCGGLLPRHGYAIEIEAEPALLEEQRQTILDFLKNGVVYAGPTVDPAWTDEEAEARWASDAPQQLIEDEDSLNVVRTDHYIVLTNQRGNTADKFGEMMEECYEKIRIVFPFEDVPGQRLLPVFLFRDKDQYIDFLVETMEMPHEQARRTGGIAYRDFYATTFTAKNDPVHLHEATHQIFRNRLHLSGGGSWFQEGVAEYVCSEPNEFNVVRNLVKKGRVVPLRELVAMPSLLFSSEADRKEGGSAGGDAYNQAGILIEFLRQSPEHAQSFQAFVHEVGAVPRNNVAAIEAAMIRTLGIGLDELEEQLVEYCSKRHRKMDRFQPMPKQRRR